MHIRDISHRIEQLTDENYHTKAAQLEEILDLLKENRHENGDVLLDKVLTALAQFGEL